MTANEILNKHEGSLTMDKEPNLAETILDILIYLAHKESGGDAEPPKHSEKLWKEISDNIEGPLSQVPWITLPTLRMILEKHKILKSENVKDGWKNNS